MVGVLIYIGSAHRTTTDAEGRYQISDLVPGDYELYCRLPQTTRADAAQREDGWGARYSDTYYFPGVEDSARAVRLKVNAGMRAGGFDFRLRRITLVDFSGRVVDRMSGKMLRGAAVELDPGNSLTDESWKRRTVMQRADSDSR
jgi:hypothetical protein